MCPQQSSQLPKSVPGSRLAIPPKSVLPMAAYELHLPPSGLSDLAKCSQMELTV